MAEETAPAIKASAVFKPSGETNIATSNASANRLSIWYSRFMKTMAPK